MNDNQKNIGFFTCEDFPGFTEDDLILADLFKQNGFNIKSVVWSKSENNLSDFDNLILRSTWDYHLRYNEFEKWINKIEKEKIKVWNPVKIIKWNMNKTYLKDFYEAGLYIVPTEFIININEETVKHILQNKWEEIVIKPSVSATAYKTWRLKKEEIPMLPEIIGNYSKDEIILVQKFMPEIKSKGELSFIFFNKVYSHAVIKTAKAGDFRVQKNFGGETKQIEPSLELISQAQKFVEFIKEDLLYARVDCVESGGKLFLMELELIEPELFFKYNNKAAHNFHNAFLELNKSKK